MTPYWNRTNTDCFEDSNSTIKLKVLLFNFEQAIYYIYFLLNNKSN